jgi:hypothetical protein
MTRWRDHTPVAIVIPPSGKLEIVRFFQAFRDNKHGKPQALHEAEARLASALGERAG